MLNEFGLISRYFDRPLGSAEKVVLGVGDDCALLAPTPGMQLAVSSDMLIEQRHFLVQADPFLLGHKSLAVNLSDLAAMGAQPLAFTLALALPAIDEDWLQGFSDGLLALAQRHDCPLVGGDTTRGPLAISITVFGEVPPGQAPRRAAARSGDDIWVSGELGEARLALAALQGEIALDAHQLQACSARLHQPEPRLALGLALRGLAHAAIDVSDGLSGDLGHILQRSAKGAVLHADALPLGPILQQQERALRHRYALTGGDDYELCFTAAPEQRDAVLAAAQSAATPVTRIGHITEAAGLRLLDADGAELVMALASFDHFPTP